MWYRVDDKKVKERKTLISLGLRREPIKSLTQDLHRSQWHQVPSRGCLRSLSRKVSTTESPRSRESARKRERERERKREIERQKRPGDLSSDEAKVL